MAGSILAMGGMGFSVLYPTPGFDQWFLDLTGKDSPCVGLVPTAGGDQQTRIEAFQLLGTRRGYKTKIISLFDRSREPLAEEVAVCDAIFVGGGNTWNMLHLWRLWGLDDLLRDAHEKGIPLGGVSAGANCWFEQCSTDSFGPGLDVMDCMGWLEGSYCPHYSGEELRRPTLERFLNSGKLKPGYAVDDGVGLHFVDGKLVEALAHEGNGGAYRVSAVDGKFVEEPMPTRPV